MSFDEYKKIHVLFSHENPKSQLSLEIKTNPQNEMDVKVRLKFLYEFGLKEFNNNSVMLAFEIDCDSLTNEIKNDFKYILPDLISNENNDISSSSENEVIKSKKDMILIEKNQNNEMMLARKKLIKNDIVTDNENNLMINSKKYYMFADQIKNKSKDNNKIKSGVQSDDEYNAIVNNLILNMNKFKNNIDEYNLHNVHDDKIELDNTPIMEYINKNTIQIDFDIQKIHNNEDDKKSLSLSMNSNESTRKYKIKNDENNEVDINSLKIKKMTVEDKLLQLLDDDPLDYKISLQKKIDYQLRLTTTMNNISPTKNIIFIITELMKYIDHFDLSGEDKKNIIISSVKTFLTYEKINEQDINFIVNTVCPELIDILISVDKRNITIKKKISCIFPWC